MVHRLQETSPLEAKRTRNTTKEEEDEADKVAGDNPPDPSLSKAP